MAKKTKKAKKAVEVRPGYRGRHGQTIGEFAVELFEKNRSQHLDDEKLMKAIKHEFPERTATWYPISGLRRKANRGELVKEAGKPGRPFQKYEGGKPVEEGRRGPKAGGSKRKPSKSGKKTARKSGSAFKRTKPVPEPVAAA